MTVSLVQETSGSTTGTTLTLTLPAAVTTGNAVIVAVCGFYGGTVSGITLGGVGSTFTMVPAAAAASNAQIWVNESTAQASPAVVITTSTAGILAWAYEVGSGVILYDTGMTGSGTSSSWSSGSTVSTIPYPHFIVGIGSIVSNTGSITSTGSGWTNETAITNVVGAGSHAIGGVSGYRTATTSGTYAYSGTSGSSSAWGAAVAAFLVVPAAGTYWGGVLFNEHASPGYTGITATFTIPSSVPYVTPSDCSVWIGLGNVYQTGIFLSPNTSFPGNVDTSCWSWWFGGGGGAGELWSTTAFPTTAGDSLTLTLTHDTQFWYATIANNTQGWSYTEVKSVLGNNAGCWGYNAATGAQTTAGWIYPVRQAEVVIEQEGQANALPDYGSITFTSITTTPAVITAPVPLFPVWNTANGINEYPGAFDTGAGSFTMYWNKGL